MVTRLAIPDAARALGVSIPTVKRRLKSGALRGAQEPTPSGFRWLVLVESPESPPESPREDSPAAPPESSESPGEDSGESPGGAPESPRFALEARRAEEMARYTATLLEPLHARLEAQALEIGALRAMLAAVTQTQSAPPAEGQAGRSWWRRLVWG